MSESRTLQEWLHWFEIGTGAKWLRACGVALGVLLLSCFIGYKQFRGPLNETTLAQAVTGRQLADGNGFSTLINYPQSYAWAQATNNNGSFVDVSRPLPELHQPPLYSAAIGVALKIAPLHGARADYVLLAVNVGLLWCAALQTFFLGRKIFGAASGVVAMLALLLSAPVWAATVAVNGTALAMVLWLALLQILACAVYGISEEDETAEWALKKKIPVLTALGAGVLCGLLFLQDYAAWVVLPVALGWAWFRVPTWRRVKSMLVIVVAAAALVSPWLVRNVLLTGNPVAFASQEFALKAGDPTADPAMQRATFSTDSPKIDFKKIGNKVLANVQRGVGEQLWSGGGIFMTAFFVAGFLYRFRDARTNHLRWFTVVMLAAFVLSRAFFDSGEDGISAWVCFVPAIAIFGAGFFQVMVTSSEMFEIRAGLAACVLLAAQGAPLARDLIQPKAAHAYNYPPYLPEVFSGLGTEMSRGQKTPLAWMADVPAGAAWYSGQRVWAMPATLDGVAIASKWQPVYALVLTSETLGKPFFGMIGKSPIGTAVSAGLQTDGAEWGDVFRGLVTGRMPDGFSMSVPARLAPDFFLLFDPNMPVQGK